MSKFIETEIGTEAGISGHFKIAIYNSDGSLSRELSFSNLITNSGMDRLFTEYNETYDRCMVGTGTATPSYTDTSLTSLFATSTDKTDQTAGVQSTDPYYGYLSRTYNFPAGTFNNTVITEVGMAWNSGLFSHALITDGSGTPTPVTLTSGQALDITYTLKLVPPTSDYTFSTSISGTSYSVTRRPIAVNMNNNNNTALNNAYGWGIKLSGTYNGTYAGVDFGNSMYQSRGTGGASYTNPYGNMGAILTDDTVLGAVTYSWPYELNNSAQSRSAYTSGNYYLDTSVTWGYGYSGARTTSTRMVMLAYGNAGAWQFLFDQAIPKSSSNTLVINSRVSLTRL
jgi:hypothetical protein